MTHNRGQVQNQGLQAHNRPGALRESNALELANESTRYMGTNTIHTLFLLFTNFTSYLLSAWQTTRMPQQLSRM